MQQEPIAAGENIELCLIDQKEEIKERRKIKLQYLCSYDSESL